MDLFKSLTQFEEKFPQTHVYQRLPAKAGKELRSVGLPEFYVKDLMEKGLREFGHGLWWLLNPLDQSLELDRFPGISKCTPIIRNAFGCFIVLAEDGYHHLDVHTRNFGLLGSELGVIFNFTLTDDYALRDMFYSEFFEYAVEHLGVANQDELYGFVPALAFGGEVKMENLQKFQLREHLQFLAQL